MGVGKRGEWDEGGQCTAACGMVLHVLKGNLSVVPNTSVFVL